jgi:hypothetical protein
MYVHRSTSAHAQNRQAACSAASRYLRSRVGGPVQQSPGTVQHYQNTYASASGLLRSIVRAPAPQVLALEQQRPGIAQQLWGTSAEASRHLRKSFWAPEMQHQGTCAAESGLMRSSVRAAAQQCQVICYANSRLLRSSVMAPTMQR